MKRKILSLCLCLCLAVPAWPLAAAAADTFAYSISPATASLSIGSEFDVIISLTNYKDTEADIRGLQIDVKEIDTKILEVVSHNTMVEDTSAASNKTSYQQSKSLIRYMYLNLSGGLDKSVTDVMKFRLRIRDDLTEEGTITLPITLKISTTEGNQITLTDSLTIEYTKAPAEVVSVEVSWGSMEFTYDDGVWDKAAHKRVNAGWKPSSADSNLITVKNAGTVDVNMQLSYTPSSDYGGLGGTIVDSAEAAVESPFALPADGTEQKYWLQLSGITETRWTDAYVTVGTITLTITE